MSEIVYLIEVAAHNGTSETTYRFSTGTGYTTLPSDTPANTHYEPRVEHPGLFRQDMFSPGATSGGSSGGYGEIVLINTDGGLDSFVDLGFDGRRCVVKQGYVSQTLAEFATVITGTVEQAEVSWNRVTLRLKDRSVELDVTLQDIFYTGANVLPAGIEGTSELKDKPKPLLYGKCNNVTPVMVNTSKLIYQICSNALSAVSAVYDNGVILTAGAAYTNQADMEANAPAAGEYRCWLAGGCFRLGSSPAGTITADAVQGAADANRTAGQIIKQVVVAKLGANQIVEQSIIDLDAAAPYVVGYYTGPDNVTAKAALDTICASVGAWWGFDNSGLFWSKQLTPPDAAQSLMTLTQAEILSLDRTATADSDKGLPIYKVNLDFSKNWTVQNSGLAGSITQNQLLFDADDGQQLSTDRRNLLAMEYIRTSATDAGIQTKHLLAPEITVQTTIDTLANANTEAARLLALRKVRRDRLNVNVPMGRLDYSKAGYWDSEAISESGGQFFGIAQDDSYVYKTGGQLTVSIKTASAVRLQLNSLNSAWEPISTLPAERYIHASVVYNGYLYVIGGLLGPTYTSTASVIRLDLSNPTGAWDDVGVTDLPVALAGCSAVVYNGYLYVFGGVDASNNFKTTARRLNLSTPAGAWDDVGVTDLPVARGIAASALWGSKVILAGGWISGFAATPLVSVLDLSNPTGAWTSEITNLPVSVYGHDIAILDGYLYFVGGGIHTRQLNLSNPTGAWDGVTNLPSTKIGCKLFVANGNLHVIGTDGSYTGNSTLIYRKRQSVADIPQLTSLGRTVTIQYPRYGYDAGRPMKIIGVESDHQSRQINLELWG